MKKILLILSFFFISLFCYAKHITGGEMIYKYLGPGTAPNTKNYAVTLLLFRDENAVGAAAMPATVSLGIFNSATGIIYQNYFNVDLSTIESVPLNTVPPCIINSPNLSYTVGYYNFNVTLPENGVGYTITYQTCCRVSGIANVPDMSGATYSTVIPGNNVLGSLGIDNSAVFSKGISVICYNRPFTLDFSATDADFDSLIYRMCDAYNGGRATDAGFAQPDGPPYGSVTYINGFSGIVPLGPLANINPQTGIISGIAPNEGKYVVSVCVDSYNKITGQYKATHRKDFIITVAPCDFAFSSIPAISSLCDGFTKSFANGVNSVQNHSFFWDFGDGNTSTNEFPVHTYADTGSYQVTLIVNPGDVCADSSSGILKVYPGFFAGILQNSPMCKGLPVQFNDSTVVTYGQTNNWSWNFGDISTLSDSSHIKNPQYTYAQPGTYTATLIVKSNKGCIDTVKRVVTILDKPQFNLGNDTLICKIDTLKLVAQSSVPGTILWSPNYMISNINSFTPLVSPDVTQTYTAVFSDHYGCTAKDSIVVNVIGNVNLSAIADTTICRGDSITLRVQSDGLTYTWTPAATLNNPNLQSPIATPVAAITSYQVTASVGNCSSKETIVVKTSPYPIANAGQDTLICKGTQAFLHASGGSSYTWIPNIYLNNNLIQNPVATPEEPVRYIVQVRDTLGCPKPVNDTVFVQVDNIIANAGPRDTSVVLNEPLQLNATGSTVFEWMPTTWLSNPNIGDPVSLPLQDIRYIVKVSNPAGCFAYDTISVHVFTVPAGIYVPNVFTPGSDGVNDIFKPITLGIRSMDYFKVFDRWGKMVFSTSQIGDGWDGKYKSTEQPIGTYVWYTKVTDYQGKVINKKGTVILVR
ncbi:MAG: gliding motility-associated C-terminal domain-containing protein [Niastella sp.]|nr:gliding motility-associated C-terminal domain-containing protein [Niastella sp.]